MNIILISTYELGHQPFGLASPAAWLREAGATVTCFDLAVTGLDQNAVAAADLIAFYIPMHTATRLAIAFLPQVRQLNPQAHLCFYGLYAPLNEDLLRSLGAKTILGGEFETGLVSLYRRLTQANSLSSGQPEPRVSLQKQAFQVPDRHDLPPLSKYAFLTQAENEAQTVGYTEASRGCKHHCRHCPVVPVYQGRFRIVQADVILADIRQQVGVGATHITFGDPDFFNGPGHALAVVEALHREWPALTYDVTIKVEHLLKHQRHLTQLRDTGCLFVTSAVESVDDKILAKFDKGHTRADFVGAVDLFRHIGLTLNPTFVAFNPWISLDGYLDFLNLIAELNLIENMAPIQYAIRLLIPAQSRLLELPEVTDNIGDFDSQGLVYPWVHADPRVDQLQQTILNEVQRSEQADISRGDLFRLIWQHVQQAIGQTDKRLSLPAFSLAAAPIPHLSEPWYC